MQFMQILVLKKTLLAMIKMAEGGKFLGDFS